jgi:CRP-like cAMP-binding protein
MSIPSFRVAKSNRILSVLPRASLNRLMPDLVLQPLVLRQVLQARDQPVEHVVFPIEGVASMVSLGDSGASLEIATIGYEGLVGLPLFLGGARASGEIFIQVPGKGLFMTAAKFERHLSREPLLNRILLRYTQALLTQVGQSAACNRHHSIIGRCARWLLQTHDRVPGDEFPLTHEFMGLMLGVRRATVTLTAQALQHRGLIKYHRGVVQVFNRVGLEKAACECYELISHEYTRLLTIGRTV